MRSGRCGSEAVTVLRRLGCLGTGLLRLLASVVARREAVARSKGCYGVLGCGLCEGSKGLVRVNSQVQAERRVVDAGSVNGLHNGTHARSLRNFLVGPHVLRVVEVLR